jgi:hypothetical protein
MTEARRILLRTQVSTLLPRDARAALREASEVESHLPRGSSMARAQAVSDAVARVRRAYPEYFRPEALTQIVT